MSEIDESTQHSAEFGHQARTRRWWLIQAILASVLFSCSAFTASAAAFLLLFASFDGSVDAAPAKLSLKVLAFSLAAGLSAIWLRKLQLTRPDLAVPDRDSTAKSSRWPSVLLTGLLCSMAVICGYGSSRSPHLEPDETHHLIVARNLATHGVYGSGQPATGFRRFDDYDSVGPTVILPVAAAMRLLGADLSAGRIAMVVFFVFLSALSHVLCIKANIGTAAAIAATALLLTAPGSLYLSRTLYGEAPALTYLIAGLVLWNAAINARHPRLLCVLAGILFGFAVVSKYFLVVALWPALGAYLFDRISYRVLTVQHIAIPLLVAGIVLAVWVAITSVWGPHGAGTAEGHISMYQHNLQFGLGSVRITLSWLAGHPLPILAYAIVGVPAAFLVSVYWRYNPSLNFLLHFAIFNSYWWIFFTTGNIPRYLWYSLAIAALFTGIALGLGFRAVRRAERRKVQMGIASIALVLCACAEFPDRLHAMLFADEMQNEYALIQEIRNNYSDRKLATTFYPAERILNLCAEIPVSRISPGDNMEAFDAVILYNPNRGNASRSTGEKFSVGPYSIIEPKAH